MKFLANLILAFNQLTQAVLERMTTATQAALLTIRGQIAYNDTDNKIVYNDGTAVQTVASETYVTGRVAANVLTVAPASANLLDITANQISLKQLAIQKVLTDITSTTLAAALAARTPVYNATNVGNGTADLQEGDVLILSAATGGMQAYIHNGGIAGTIADFTLLETPNLDTAAIRALLSAANAITYNATTGQFKLGGNITESTTLALSSFPFAIQRSEGLSTNEFSIDPATKATTVKGGGGGLDIGQTSFTFRIGAFAASNGGAVILDQRTTKTGLQYQVDYSATFTDRSLVDKAYADKVGAKRSTQTVTTVANTWLTVTHAFALADKDSVSVMLWEAGRMVMAEVETVDVNSIRIRTGTAITDLKVFVLA